MEAASSTHLLPLPGGRYPTYSFLLKTGSIKPVETSNNHIGNQSASTKCATAYPTRLCTVLTEQYGTYCSYRAIRYVLFIQSNTARTVLTEQYGTYCSYWAIRYVLFLQSNTARTVLTEQYSTYCSYRAIRYVLFLQSNTARTVLTEQYSTYCSYRAIQYVLFLLSNTVRTVLTEQYSTYCSYWAIRYYYWVLLLFTFLWRCDPTWVMASSFLRFSRSHTTHHIR
jgi:hypothetical protein